MRAMRTMLIAHLSAPFPKIFSNPLPTGSKLKTTRRIATRSATHIHGLNSKGFCSSTLASFLIWDSVLCQTRYGDYHTLNLFVCKEISRQFFCERNGSESRPHSSPDPSCGREISRGKTKNPFPQKNRFSFCRVRIEAPRTARILGGQNPKKKNVLSIFRKNWSRANPKSKEHFLFLGLLAYSPVRGDFSESFVLKVGSSLVQ